MALGFSTFIGLGIVLPTRQGSMNKFERMKHEKDGLDVYPDLMRAAREGWETLDDDDVARLKWYGLYPHNAKDGHFMLRIKVVQGVLTGEQADDDRRHRGRLRARLPRLHDAPVRPDPLDHARQRPRDLRPPRPRAG